MKNLNSFTWHLSMLLCPSLINDSIKWKVLTNYYNSTSFRPFFGTYWTPSMQTSYISLSEANQKYFQFTCQWLTPWEDVYIDVLCIENRRTWAKFWKFNGPNWRILSWRGELVLKNPNLKPIHSIFSYLKKRGRTAKAWGAHVALSPERHANDSVATICCLYIVI